MSTAATEPRILTRDLRAAVGIHVAQGPAPDGLEFEARIVCFDRCIGYCALTGSYDDTVRLAEEIVTKSLFGMIAQLPPPHTAVRTWSHLDVDDWELPVGALVPR